MNRTNPGHAVARGRASQRVSLYLTESSCRATVGGRPASPLGKTRACCAERQLRGVSGSHSRGNSLRPQCVNQLRPRCIAEWGVSASPCNSRRARRAPQLLAHIRDEFGEVARGRVVPFSHLHLSESRFSHGVLGHQEVHDGLGPKIQLRSPLTFVHSSSVRRAAGGTGATASLLDCCGEGGWLPYLRATITIRCTSSSLPRKVRRPPACGFDFGRPGAA